MNFVVSCLPVHARLILTGKLRQLACGLAEVVHGRGLAYHKRVLCVLDIAELRLFVLNSLD